MRCKRQTGKVFYFERIECRGCRWFRSLNLEEEIAIPPTLSDSVIGACERKRNIIMNGKPSKHCPYVEGEPEAKRAAKKIPIEKIKVLGRRILGKKAGGGGE
jgi:hypothetical protein